MTPGFWGGRRVFVTGHTGFKGAWLSLWLQRLGAQVHGFATEPPTEPNLFTLARVRERLAGHTIGDVRDAAALKAALLAAAPDVVLHLAAQPLVRYAYREPVETYAVNVMGTVHLLEAVRAAGGVRAAIAVTTDKCYENREWLWGYREHEALGGHDPYASSKAAAELVTAAYRASFLREQGVALASARAGNVIGGGDWAADRLLPDFFRAMSAGTVLAVRHPEAVRPWQHVIECLAGYLALAEALYREGEACAEAWNFGPRAEDARSVRWILDYLSAHLPGARWQHHGAIGAHEARALRLDSSKAEARLGWRPHWSLEQALDRTVAWYQGYAGQADLQALCLGQIEDYQRTAGH